MEHDNEESLASTTRVQAILCGILITILAGAWFGRFVRYTRPPSDEVAPAIKAYIDRAVYRALRDPVGRRDFALFGNGGRVVPDLTVILSPDGQISHGPEALLKRADYAITDDLRVGQCWSIPGSTAQLSLRLSELMHPTHVSIDHIPAEIAARIDEAPRTMILWAAVDGSVNKNIAEYANYSIPGLRGRSQPPHTCGHTYIPLATFEYDIRAPSHVQTFMIGQHLIDAGVYTGVVVLEILGNWGGSSTCLYRIRVHGETLIPGV